MFRNGFIFRLIGVLLLLGLVAGGAFMAYNAGVAQGVAQAPEVAIAIEKAAEEDAPVSPMYGYAHGYPHPLVYGYTFGYSHHFNPFGMICGSILFLFLFFGFMKMIFFRGMRHGWGHHGHWGKDWEGNVPPFFSEWHKRAHGEGDKPAEEKKEEDK